MDRFLVILNKLQDAFTTAGVLSSEIDLPQIVVVGSQSTGKSSVLENIAKQNFLPRGGGIVTRRPLVLQMSTLKEAKVIEGVEHSMYAEFLHTGDRVFTEVEEIQQEILDDTDRLCGVNKGVSEEAITLKLYSTTIPSLTLVDLPGLTKIPVGDQPSDIDQKIERLVRSYIVKENSIILAVSAGNVDIANSESIRLAREVDPKGSRTIAVITKCDLMEQNKEAFALLEGTSVDVKLGLIGVINRNSSMLEEKTPIDQVLEKEENFFLDHYPTLSDRMGTVFLTEQLCDILILHLKRCLPILSGKIHDLQRHHQQILKKLGEEQTDNNQVMIVMLSKFTDNFAKSIDGQYSYEKRIKSDPTETKYKVVTTSAGAELFGVFQKQCNEKILKTPIHLKDLKSAIKGTAGVQPALFVPDVVFQTLIVKQLKLFDAPSKKAIEKSHECLVDAVDSIASKTLHRYPRLKLEVVGITKACLKKEMESAQRFLEEYLEIEKSYINTNHPEFVERYAVAADLFSGINEEEEKKEEQIRQAKKQAVASQFKFGGPPVVTIHDGPSASSSKKSLVNVLAKYDGEMNNEVREEQEAKLMETLLMQYFCITRGHLIDMIPKTVMRFLVRRVTDNLNGILIKDLYQSDKVAELIRESDSIVKRRRASAKMLKVLVEAEKLVAGIALGRESIYEA